MLNQKTMSLLSTLKPESVKKENLGSFDMSAEYACSGCSGTCENGCLGCARATGD
jgi:hypothetical protein